MKKCKFFVAFLMGKLSLVAIKILSRFVKKEGTTLPGNIVLKICPEFLKYIGKPSRMIAVTGTNGKTTTNNMIADVLSMNGYKVLSNRAGGNIAAGIATCLLRGVDLLNRSRYDVAALEIDERSSKRIYPYVQPDFIVCSNLSRDSCKRNAHPQYIFDFIDQNLPDRSVLILNADDLISSRLKKENARVYYAIDRQESDKTEPFNIINDVRICPNCQEKLVFDYVRYNHIGHAHCPNCGLESPKPDFHVTSIDETAKQITVSEKGEMQTYPLVFDSIFNIYNEISAITALRSFGLGHKQIADALKKVSVVGSRFSQDEVKGIRIISTMTKGWIAPSCSVAFDFVANFPGEKEIVVMIEDTDDNIQSSENLCYIYDTDFEFLNKPDIRHITVCGIRAKDYLLRMLLAGIPREKISCVREIPEIAGTLTVEKGVDFHIIYDLHQMEAFHQIRNLVIEKIKQEG
ncbi:MAG: DUF1727 domain-containing protein [Firmicutes bacterium]|nr:DUF1727 domain-containing protein [Bacillota bacterium]